MENPNTNDLLKLHDDPANTSASVRFDSTCAFKRFRLFLYELNAAAGDDFRFECGGQTEDATFHSQVFISDSEDDICFIRFSNFGDLVSIYSDHEVDRQLNKLILSLLAKHNYTYLPFAETALEYTGLNAGRAGIDTWWSRYFGWIC